MLKHIISGLIGALIFFVGAGATLYLIGYGLLLRADHYAKVVAPRLHAENTARAEATDAAIWESGFGTVYTIATTIEVDGRVAAAAADAICVRKVETKFGDGFKSHVTVSDYIRTIGAYDFVVRSTEDREAIFRIGDSCQTLKKLARDRQPLPVAMTFYANTGGLGALKAPFATCEVPAPTLPWPMVVAVQEVPVRELLTREEYGPADLTDHQANALRATKIAPRRMGPSYYWRKAEQWWWSSQSQGCDAEAAQFCSSLLKGPDGVTIR